MSEVPPIVELSRVIEPHLDGAQLVSYSSRYLTKPGDNYGSVMLALSANVKRPNGEIEELPVVAKLPPLTNDLYWQIFQPERTSVTENTVYKYLAPAYRQLQLDAGVPESELFDGFPRYYGSRISLDESSTKVDRDAVLLQENLQTSGYRAGDRHKMFDFAHTTLVLENLAQYHALAIALRLKNPEEFQRNIRPHFNRFNMNTTMPAEAKEQMRTETLKEIEFATNNNEKAVQRVTELFDLWDEFLTLPEAEDGIWTTLVHCDMWINNLMLQYDEDGLPSQVKIVDFQIAQYESLLHDIIFFLFSSVDAGILEQHFDDFMSNYYQTFIKCLDRVGVPTKIYSYEAFLKEAKRVGPLEILHALFMTKIILADNSTMPEDFKDMDMSIMSKNSGMAEISQKTGEIVRLAKKFKFFD